VVIQVESCEVVLLVGYRPSSGEASDALLARAAGQPKTQGLDALRTMLAQQAMAPLVISVDGKPLVPTAVRTKIGAEPGGARPMLVLLVTYALPAGSTLSVTSKDARTTRISWADRDSHRVDLQRSAMQGKWFDGVASFLLPMAPSIGGLPSCATSRTSALLSRSARSP
jgi:hypothetical protein